MFAVTPHHRPYTDEPKVIANLNIGPRWPAIPKAVHRPRRGFCTAKENISRTPRSPSSTGFCSRSTAFPGMFRRVLGQGLRATASASASAAAAVAETTATVPAEIRTAVAPAVNPVDVPPERGSDVLRTKLRRLEVIHDPGLNRGSGFSVAERERLGLRGLVPPRWQGLDQQIERVMITYRRQKSPLDKFQFLSMLMDRNTVLFYRILADNFKELAPIIYTPTVGQACIYSHAIYRRTRGMYFSAEDRGHFQSMVYNWPEDDVEVIVATDGSRILGLGDLGANGMQIPIGKLALYVSGGGINPRKTLPVVIDVGTNNMELRENDLYLGLPRPRLEGKEYWSLIDEWMSAVRMRWPNVLVQFEDFSSDKALPMLQKYRNKHLCFNDDIQSTGCIALAAVLASLRARKKSVGDLLHERIVCVGAGSAGLGVCNTIVQAMVDEGSTEEEAFKRFYMVDKDGLLGSGRDLSAIPEAQRRFVRSDLPDGTPLEDLVGICKPTVLFGLSGIGGLFTEPTIREMARHVDRPVVFPLSNPSEMSECTAEQAFEWTDGRAIFASGSPFEDVRLPNGGVGTTNQCNNVFSFPGLGLAITALEITSVTDSMIQAAARCISEIASAEDVASGLLFPRIEGLRDVSVRVAAAVGTVAMNEGLARKPIPAEHRASSRMVIKYLRKKMWAPEYGHFVAE